MLNGNKVPWTTVVYLANNMAKLDELHASANNLENPGNNLVIEVKLTVCLGFSQEAKKPVNTINTAW